MKRLWLILLFPILLVALLWWGIKYIWASIFAPDHAWTLAISADQLANSAFNGDPDRTISSRAYYHSREDEHRECWAVFICWILDHIDKNHCEKSKDV